MAVTSQEPTQPTRQSRLTALIQVSQPPEQAVDRERRARRRGRARAERLRSHRGTSPARAGGRVAWAQRRGNVRSEDMDEIAPREPS